MRVVALLLLSLACGLALSGCRRAGTGGVAAVEGVDSLVEEVNSFTEAVAGKVESAEDPKAGVEEAQKLFDARSGDVASHIAAFKRSPQMQDAGARRKWLEAEVDDTQRLSQLQVTYSDARLRDPEFKSRLDKLIADFDSMFKDSPAR